VSVQPPSLVRPAPAEVVPVRTAPAPRSTAARPVQAPAPVEQPVAPPAPPAPPAPGPESLAFAVSDDEPVQEEANDGTRDLAGVPASDTRGVSPVLLLPAALVLLAVAYLAVARTRRRASA
jgi:hypothetical protein